MIRAVPERARQPKARSFRRRVRDFVPEAQDLAPRQARPWHKPHQGTGFWASGTVGHVIYDVSSPRYRHLEPRARNLQDLSLGHVIYWVWGPQYEDLVPGERTLQGFKSRVRSCEAFGV